ncbi:hypothetical protein SLA2020_450200 [Shorea laevis]
MLNGFREAVADCELTEVRTIGFAYTWSRRGVEEKLDRALAFREWQLYFPQAMVRSLLPLGFDHSPFLIDKEGGRKKGKRFKFEEMWLRDEQCHVIVERGWNGQQVRRGLMGVMHRLKECATALDGWNLTQFGNTSERVQEEREALREVEEWLTQGEMMWRQRLREVWLQDGDRNTKFFHGKASRRRDGNTMSRLMDASGVWKTDFVGLQEIAMSYFHDLFSSSHPSNIEEVTSCLERQVTSEANQDLLKEFKAEEVTAALFQMHPSKAPGPNGMSPSFFQQFWLVVGKDVIDACLGFLNVGGSLPKELKFTHIILIPKVGEPRTMGDLHPISFCNVVYRIIAKVLANRLKQVLLKVISME